MKIDLHAHTNRYSRCAVISPSDLIQECINKNLDAVCITEHFTIWPNDEQDSLQEEFKNKIKIFFGYEIRTEIGDVLVFSPEVHRFTYNENISFKQLPLLFPRNNSAFIWAHPYRWTDYKESDAEIVAACDAVELYSGNMQMFDMKYTEKMLQGMTKNFTGGSDTHSHKMVGRYYTQFKNTASSLEELIQLIKEGEYMPCESD